MRYRPFGGPDIEDVIYRSLHDDVTSDELAWLTQWRRHSLANEQQYRRTVRVLEVMRQDAVAMRPVPAAQAILSRARGAHAAPLRRARLRGLHALPTWLGAAAIVAVSATVVAVGSALLRDRVAPVPRAESPAAGGVGYATGASEMATVQLSDGSVVRLAPSSKLRFVQRAASREATLEGRAFFAVAKIPGRPFRVHTRLGDATVLGTRFELATDPRELHLLVVSGRVGLSGKANQVEVHGGEASDVRDGTVAEPTRLPNAANMGEWVGKFLAFQSTPMREVGREIEEVYGVRVVIEDSVIANRTVIGTFTDRDVRDVIDMVCSVVNARCVTRPGEVVVTGR